MSDDCIRTATEANIAVFFQVNKLATSQWMAKSKPLPLIWPGLPAAFYESIIACLASPSTQ